jgi:hypothetical protein
MCHRRRWWAGGATVAGARAPHSRCRVRQKEEKGEKEKARRAAAMAVAVAGRALASAVGRLAAAIGEGDREPLGPSEARVPARGGRSGPFCPCEGGAGPSDPIRRPVALSGGCLQAVGCKEPGRKVSGAN